MINATNDRVGQVPRVLSTSESTFDGFGLCEPSFFVSQEASRIGPTVTSIHPTVGVSSEEYAYRPQARSASKSTEVASRGRKKVSDPFAGWPEYSRAVNQLGQIIESLRAYGAADLSVEAVGESLQLEELAETIRSIEYGEFEALKKVSVTILSQVRSAVLTAKHVDFLSEVFAVMSSTKMPNDDMAMRIHRAAKNAGLDPYRGILSPASSGKRYKLIEVDEDA